MEKAGRVHDGTIHQAQIVVPEDMSGKGTKGRQDLGYNSGGSRRIEIGRTAHDAQHGVFGERTSCPLFPARGMKPAMRRIMVNVEPIDQGNQYVHIEQERHGNSSRSRFTSSIVTGLPSGRRGSRGTPLRVLACRLRGARPFLASVEITSPTLFPSLAASPFAAARTSSSMASVVLMHQSSRINHQKSTANLNPAFPTATAARRSSTAPR